MSEELKSYLIINAVPHMDELSSFQSYLPQIVKIFQSYEGKMLGRYKTIEQIMGNGGIKAIAIFEFPDVETIKRMKASEEFNALNELRAKAYKQEVDLMICEHL